MILLRASGDDGHRREYAALFSRLFAGAGEPATMVRSGIAHTLSSLPILFMMIEDSPLEFFATAILRAGLRRRTVGLLFRPVECLRPRSVRHLAKRFLLLVIKGLPLSASIAVLPEAIEPRLKQISRYTMFDPQLWDLTHDQRACGQSGATSDCLEAIKSVANGRHILIALGRQDRTKGFDYFTRLWCSSEALRQTWLFVAAGKIDVAMGKEAALFERHGGLLINRFVDLDELIALYKAATVVWCCYAPEYDQSSGIFGRAVQLGVPIVARLGSYIERFAVKLGHPFVSIPWDRPSFAASLIMPAQRSARVSEQTIEEMRRVSTDVVLSSLGVDSRQSRP